MREVAGRYGALFADVEKQWCALLKSDPTAAALPDENAEALRRVLYGSDSPCFVPDEHLANIEWFFPTDTVVELWKLQGEVDRWLIQSAEAPAHATILVDRAKPATPRVFKRSAEALHDGQRTPRARAGDHRAGQSADRPCDGESGVDAAFRARPRHHDE
jgi:hypothetical protein